MKMMHREGSRGKNLDDDYTKEGTELELKPTPFFLNVLLSNLEEGHENTFERSLGCIHSHSTSRWP